MSEQKNAIEVRLCCILFLYWFEWLMNSELVGHFIVSEQVLTILRWLDYGQLRYVRYWAPANAQYLPLMLI